MLKVFQLQGWLVRSCKSEKSSTGACNPHEDLCLTLPDWCIPKADSGEVVVVGNALNLQVYFDKYLWFLCYTSVCVDL